MSNNIQFQGIVAVGNTRHQSVLRYRMAAMGKGVACFVDRGNGTAFVSNASADLENVFNPANGNLDLEQSDDALKDLQFTAKAGDVHEAYHYQCTAGCGSHIVYDNVDLVQNCPVCASAVASSDDEESEDDSEDLSDDELDDLDEDSEEDEESDDSDDSDPTASDEDDSEEEEDTEDADEEDLDEESDEDAEDDSEDDEEIEDEELEDDDSDDDSEEEEESDDSDSDDTEEDEMSDAPLVVAASSRNEAINQFSKLQGKRLVATASADSTSVLTAHYMVCASDSGCGAHIVGEQALTQCPRAECGEALSEPQEESSESGDEHKASLSIIPGASGEDTDAIDEDEEESDEDEGDEEEGDDEEEETSESSDAGTTTEGEDTSEPKQPETEPAQPAPVTTPAPEGEGQATASDDEDEDELMDEVSIDTLDELPDDVDVDDVDVSYSAAIAGKPAWTAYHKGQPIAMATAATIQKDHTDMFGTARFGSVAIAAAKIGGAKKVLGELGFKGFKVAMSVPKHVESRVTALASDQKAQLEVQGTEHAERLEAALATAMVGINRGFFANMTNPVRESLMAALSGVGVRNPNVIVDNALRSSFDVLIAQAFDKAREIMSKPEEVQTSLAQTVLETNYQQVDQAATASAGNHLENRLANIGTAVASSDVPASKPEPAATAVASDDAFVQRLSNLTFGTRKR